MGRTCKEPRLDAWRPGRWEAGSGHRTGAAERATRARITSVGLLKSYDQTINAVPIARPDCLIFESHPALATDTTRRIADHFGL
ncbi:MAG: hypothetical protein AAGG57_01790 [Pseudomonadota bacterium]